jgi:hypothetical protein
MILQFRGRGGSPFQECDVVGPEGNRMLWLLDLPGHVVLRDLVTLI